VAGGVVLPGHFQTALYSFFALALFLAADLALRRDSWRRTALVLATTAVAAFALSAVMVLPGLELTGQSERAAADYSHSAEGTLAPGALATLVSPDHYGAPEGPETYSGPADITQFFLYQGLLLLPLAAWGAVAWGKRWLALALVVPAAWYAFGRPLGFYSLTSLLPGFKSVRAPIHIWFVAALGLALLAAAGVEALRARFRSPWIPVAMLLVVGGDLYYWNMDHNALAYARASFQDQYGAAEERFKTVAGPATRDPLHRLYVPFDPPNPGVGPLNGSLDNRIEVTYGYNPLALVRYSEYMKAAQGNPRLLDSLAVTARLNSTTGQFEPNSGALPRVYAPERVTPARGREDAAARLPSLDAAREAVVEGLPAAMPSNGGATVRIANYEGGLYRVRYQADRPTLLRVAVPYFPGWKAEVDGQSAKVLPADLALLGVLVPAGSHELTLRYRSTWFFAGAAISLLSWMALLVWLARSRKA
jgi:Bacterial membrane protein YfhO